MATCVPFTQTSASPTTPLTVSVAYCPGRASGRNSVRNHHGTANRGTVSLPTWLS